MHENRFFIVTTPGFITHIHNGIVLNAFVMTDS